jgi:hypothetical protein
MNTDFFFLVIEAALNQHETVFSLSGELREYKKNPCSSVFIRGILILRVNGS